MSVGPVRTKLQNIQRRLYHYISQETANCAGLSSGRPASDHSGNLHSQRRRAGCAFQAHETGKPSISEHPGGVMSFFKKAEPPVEAPKGGGLAVLRGRARALVRTPWATPGCATRCSMATSRPFSPAAPCPRRKSRC